MKKIDIYFLIWLLGMILLVAILAINGLYDFYPLVGLYACSLVLFFFIDESAWRDLKWGKNKKFQKDNKEDQK